jgi:hypothetical protein
MPTLIVGDLHGDWRGLRALLRQAGAIDPEGRRAAGWRLVQLGDIIHGGHGVTDDDARCLADGLAWFDTILVGNHELPYLWPQGGFALFAGMTPPLPETLVLLARARDEGRFAVATAIDGRLVTHAGLHPALAAEAGIEGDAEAQAAALEEEFARRLTGFGYRPVFDAVGRARGGGEALGGIFWLDWRDLAGEAGVPQIVGHTPQRGMPVRAGEHWCVDVGAALSGLVCGLVRDTDGDEWHLLVTGGGRG